MGRHAGFLTASSSLLKKKNDDGPHLVFIPESPFDIKIFLEKVKFTFEKYGRCIVAISEGIQDEKKKLISQKITKKQEYDAHGNIQLSGTGSLGDFLSNQIKNKLKLPRVRSDTLGYPQRCFVGSASEIDQKEAHDIGVFSAEYSLLNSKSFSAGILERKAFTKNYKIKFIANSLQSVAGKTKVMPKTFYDNTNNKVNKIFYDYALPLIGKNITQTKTII